MTADAKVGLLLGLFFIVIIAFLVNGLPNFIQKENTSPPNAAIVTPPDVITQVLLGIPLVLLYEFSILISKTVERNKKRKEKQQTETMENP